MVNGFGLKDESFNPQSEFPPGLPVWLRDCSWGIELNHE